MKVGGNGTSGNGDLFERMRQAHREVAQAGEVAQASPTADAGEAASVGTAGAPGVDAHADPVDQALQSRLLDVASDALEGAYDSPHHVREAVVEAIVSQRYAPKLPAATADQIMHTMKATLSTDPVFCQEVDRMLVLAARELGSAAAGGR